MRRAATRDPETRLPCNHSDRAMDPMRFRSPRLSWIPVIASVPQVGSGAAKQSAVAVKP